VRILHTLASPVLSGPAEAVAELALAGRAAGHQVTVAVDRKRTSTRSEEPSLPYFEELGLLDEGGLELSVKSSLPQMWRDVRALKRHAVDVVHAHFSHDHMLAALGRPHGAALVRSIHAPRSLTWATPAPDAFTVPTDSLVEEVKKERKAEVMVLPALIGERYKPSSDRLALRSRLGIEGEPLIGMVSTFQPSRHHDVGLDAFQLLLHERPKARMVLLGDGELEWELRARVAAHGANAAVTFAGYQQHSEYLSWLQSFDEVWVLGLGNDWAGRAAAQARACGVRVLAIDEGALSKYADVVVPLEPEAVMKGSLSGERREVALETPAQIAARVLELYAKVKK